MRKQETDRQRTSIYTVGTEQTPPLVLLLLLLLLFLFAFFPNRRSQVAMYTCRSLVESVPFFQDKSRSFVISTVSKLEPRVYMQGELIVRQGDISNEVYFVSEGEIDVEINGQPRIHLSKVSKELPSLELNVYKSDDMV